MFNFSAVSAAIHAVCPVILVGGLFFAYTVLRPSLGVLEMPQRLTLLNEVFRRFFAIIWVFLIVLPATGYLLMYLTFGGFSGAGGHVHGMHAMNYVIMGLFVFLYFVPYPRFREACSCKDWSEAAERLVTIRRIIAINMTLGLVTIAIGASGRFWS